MKKIIISISLLVSHAQGWAVDTFNPENGQLTIPASDAGVVYDDGSVDNGYFGVQNSLEFDASIASQPLTRHFPGINNTAIADNINNVTIGARTNSISNYIYLDIQVGSSGTGLRSGAYKIFFDFT